LVYSFVNIISGSIWARPAWNTWWTWDPRLVTATVMELIYLAYLMLRQGIEEPERRARFGAVYSILGFVSVPLTYYSIRIWRTIHPVVIGSGAPSSEGIFDMTATMTQTFMFALLTFTVLGATIIWHRYRLGKLQDKVESMRIEALNE
jgi:heme exporter protein C